MGTHNTGVVGSNPTRVTVKTQFVIKATGNHLIKSTSLEETQSSVSGAALEVEYATQSDEFFRCCDESVYEQVQSNCLILACLNTIKTRLSDF